MDQILEFFAVRGYLILLLPVVGAAIGWITNYIAVKMLFHPRRPWGPFKIQGVFPKRQAALATKVGDIVSRELISTEMITGMLIDKARSKKVSDLVADRVEHVLTEKLPLVMPMVTMVLTPELVKKIVGLFIGDLENVIERIVTDLGQEMQDEIDIRHLVEQKVRDFSSEKLEALLVEVMKREFTFIEVLGGVLGFIIGCGQLGFLLITA